jgi:ABC-2 type transport system permease protein
LNPEEATVTSDSFVGAPSATTERDAALAALLRPPTLGELVLSYLNGALVVAEIEFRKLRHDPWELVTRAVQPVLWLVIFGQAFSRIRAIPTGGVSYLTFMTPGILAQSLMFVSIFYGLSIIWERDAGIVQKFLILPIPRASFVTGKGLGAGVRAVSQAIFIFLIALLLGVHLRWSVTGLLGSILAVIVGASFFSTLSMLIATIVKTRERFMGIGQVITMPLFFASNAIYPLSIMPDWLRVLSQINPLSYVVDLLRGYLVVGSVPNAVLDWAVLLAAVIIAQAIAAQRYHTIVI